MYYFHFVPTSHFVIINLLCLFFCLSLWSLVFSFLLPSHHLHLSLFIAIFLPLYSALPSVNVCVRGFDEHLIPLLPSHHPSLGLHPSACESLFIFVSLSLTLNLSLCPSLSVTPSPHLVPPITYQPISCLPHFYALAIFALYFDAVRDLKCQPPLFLHDVAWPADFFWQFVFSTQIPASPI